MPDSADLLAVARSLLSVDSTSPAFEAHLRRAVSTAYYALFHHVLRSAAERFMGFETRHSAGYDVIYHGFNHGRMKTVCEALNVAFLGKSLARQLGRSSVSQDARNFAGGFSTLQDARHQADYDPSVLFVPSDASGLVEAAYAAMTAFDRIAPDEKADILALTLVNPRG